VPSRRLVEERRRQNVWRRTVDRAGGRAWRFTTGWYVPSSEMSASSTSIPKTLIDAASDSIPLRDCHNRRGLGVVRSDFTSSGALRSASNGSMATSTTSSWFTRYLRPWSRRRGAAAVAEACDSDRGAGVADPRRAVWAQSFVLVLPDQALSWRTYCLTSSGWQSRPLSDRRMSGDRSSAHASFGISPAGVLIHSQNFEVLDQRADTAPLYSSKKNGRITVDDFRSRP